MGKLVEKPVRMGPDDWRKLGEEAVTLAVVAIHDGANPAGRSQSLINAAEMLRAAKTLTGHGNILEIDGGVNEAVVDVWDLSDEERDPDAPAWPQISAKLHEIAGDDARLLPMVEQIDRLHEVAVEKGLPQVTVGQLAEALEAA